MSINIPHDKSDSIVDQIKEALCDYDSEHPGARIDLYRQNSVSVRLRIVDPGFDGQSKPNRSAIVWQYLAKLPEDVQSDISMVLLLTPEEQPTSFANTMFDNPQPSRL